MSTNGDNQPQPNEPEMTAPSGAGEPAPEATANAASTQTPPPAGTTAPAVPAEPSLWPARLSRAASVTYDWVMQPRVRLAIAGVIVALIGAGPASGSVWTLPLVIVGVIMIVIACIGHRLRGRFVIEWGESGAEIGFSASVTPVPDRPRVHAVAPSVRARSSQLGAGAATPPSVAAGPAAVAPGAADDDDVIEGEAHTVEIDVAELKALIAAAENAENGNGPAARGGAWREVNVHRLTSSPRPAEEAESPLRENRG